MSVNRSARQRRISASLQDSSLVPEAQVAGDSKIKKARGRRISESGEAVFNLFRQKTADLRYLLRHRRTFGIYD